VKNWGGIGVIDMPNGDGIRAEAFAAFTDKLVGCWHCPIVCKGLVKGGAGEYKYTSGCHRPEYETISAFGVNCLNDHTESIIMINDICNRAGIDTIAAGAIIAFAVECYEGGILTRKDTDGIDLKWSSHRAIVEMTEKLAKREGLGAVLADGVKKAAERIGKGSEKYAVHIGGAELGQHDPKLSVSPALMPAARYLMDATPGRHTQDFGPSGFRTHVCQSAGLCRFGSLQFQTAAYAPEKDRWLLSYLNGVTGFNYSLEEMLKAGERIANIRHVFNLREGINELKLEVHPRIVGKPPQDRGPLAGVTADMEAQTYWCLGTLDWDRVTTKPSKAKLLSLGLGDVADDLWIPKEQRTIPPALLH
jgi:aldehyde:ferredoxin oxidoreductase